MRGRTLFAIVLVMFALPALASDPQRLRWNEPHKPTPNPDTLVAIADLRLGAALDENAAPGIRGAFLDSARDGYRQALTIDPKHKGALLGLAHYYARTEQRECAVEAYKKYLTLYPTDAGAAHELGQAHAAWKDWAGAVVWCEHALKIDPEHRAAQNTLGFCLAFTEKWDEAFAVLCRVMPEARARLNLASALQHRGRADACKEQLRLALTADPSYAPARDLLRELGVAAAPVEPEPLPLAHRGAIGGCTRAFGPVEMPVVRSREGAAPAGPQTAVAYKLRSVAATDAIAALAVFAHGKAKDAHVTADPITNTVYVSGGAEIQKQLGEMLAALDKEPQQILAQVAVLRVSRSVVVDAGLNAGGDTLSPREMQMFNALLRAAKERGECEVLSRPQVQVRDGQQGRAYIGHQVEVVSGFEIVTAGGAASLTPKREMVATGLSLELTPRLSTDGAAVLLDAHFKHTEQTGEVKKPLAVEVNGEVLRASQIVTVPTFATRAIRATADVTFGHTMVFSCREDRGALAGAADKYETLVVVTPHLVKPKEPVRPEAGWFLK